MIHRYWHGPPADEWTGKCLRSIHPDMQVTDWTDELLPEQVVDWLYEHQHDVREADYFRHRANMVRLWLLNEYGGWWVDHDVLLLQPLTTLPYPMVAAHGTMACNSVMGLPAGHPLLAEMLTVADAAQPSDARSPDVCGERVLDRLRHDHPDVHLLRLAYSPAGRWQHSTWAIHLYNWMRST
jgi:hypothetical protein